MDFKVAILDDEVLMREGLELKYPFTANGFEIIFSGDDGNILIEKLDTFELQPDLIFVDIIMPKLNGLNFIQRVLENHVNIDIVIVSGFDEFEFAQQAIRLGVKEYLLKPLNPTELEKVMNRIKDSLEQKKELRLLGLQEEINNWIEHKNIRQLSINTLAIFNRLLVENLNLSIVSLGNFKSEPQRLFEAYSNQTYPIKYLGFNNLFIHFSKQHSLNAILNNHTTNTATAVHFTNIKRAEEIPYCIQYAMNIIQLNLTLGKKTLHSIEWNKDLIEQKGIVFNEHYQAILLLFNKEKDKDKDKDKEKGYIELKKLLNRQMPQKLKEEIVKHFAREQFQLEVSSEWLQGFVNKEEFTNECMFLFKELGYSIPLTTGKEILQSVLYDLKKEFPLKVSLKEYATRYHIHPNHLVRLFKKEMNTTFNDTLTMIRLEKAKDDLLNSEKLINDIASDVGYEDARYFSQVFRKYFNMTPKDFRKRFQRG